MARPPGGARTDGQGVSTASRPGRQSLHGTSTCYRDAWEAAHPGEPGHTFGDQANPLGADWDWPFHGGPTLVVTDCARHFDRPGADGTWASDHYGLTATLAPPPR